MKLMIKIIILPFIEFINISIITILLFKFSLIEKNDYIIINIVNSYFLSKTSFICSITISLIPLASLKIIGTSKFKNPCVKYLNSYTLMSIFAFLNLLIYLH